MATASHESPAPESPAPSPASPSTGEPAPDLARHWTLDPEVAFLNHGSFGACPRPVLETQAELRARMERQPVDFFVRRYEGLLDAAREELASFLGADPEGLVPVPNATTGVNSVLRSLTFQPGDELVTTDHEYNACRNALDFVAERHGATVRVAQVPFPLRDSERILDALRAEVGPKTRLLLIDHITSQTGLVLPLESWLPELSRRGAGRDVEVLVDGAHAPGMLPLDLRALTEAGVNWYSGNCHKWLCAPKGAGFLYAREDRREAVRPTVISHGANTPRPGRSRFHTEFDWVGTDDPTAFLSVPAALRFLGSLLPGGWREIREHNRRLALAGRSHLCAVLGIDPPAPEEMIGSLATVPLPDGSPEPPRSALYADPLQERLLGEHGVEVPIIPWPAPPKRLLRISAQLYNHEDQYRQLAEALRAVLA